MTRISPTGFAPMDEHSARVPFQKFDGSYVERFGRNELKRSGARPRPIRDAYRKNTSESLVKRLLLAPIAALPIACAGPKAGTFTDAWVLETQAEWTAGIASRSHLDIADGSVRPTAETASLRSILKTYATPRSIQSLTVEQVPLWQNWNPSPNVGPTNLKDAPVLLARGADDYWMFGRYGKPPGASSESAGEPFLAKATSLEGFSVPLHTTPFPLQFDAPGGLEPSLGGYHAWQSRDMIHWVHHGPVTEAYSKWVTTAEYVDGQTFIYYDYPNDQDPHAYVDGDLTDGKPGRDMGVAFRDPSDGSDCAFIRDADGKFHVFYEDWTPINASKRSWDSPLAGHAVSPDGLANFEILEPAVDHRTTPTGATDTYLHPHWMQHPDFDSNLATYEVHEPEQPAYGDWASICIDGRYYLFGDYDPPGGHPMSVGWFTAPSINGPFSWCDHVGQGHPDPDIAFAEGQFYLVTQQAVDFTSPGPWVEQIQARVGVDTNGDGSADTWSAWSSISESYNHVPGFAKHVQKTPARLELPDLPSGYGFQFEIQLTDKTDNKSTPVLEKITLEFDG